MGEINGDTIKPRNPATTTGEYIQSLIWMDYSIGFVGFCFPALSRAVFVIGAHIHAALPDQLSGPNILAVLYRHSGLAVEIVPPDRATGRHGRRKPLS